MPAFNYVSTLLYYLWSLCILFHSMFGYMRLMISRLSILPSAAYNEDVMPMVLPCVWCPQRTRTTMIEVTNGVCRVLTCFIFTGLSTLPFESCSLLLFECVIYPLSLIFACYFVRTICAEDKDTYDTPDWLSREGRAYSMDRSVSAVCTRANIWVFSMCI